MLGQDRNIETPAEQPSKQTVDQKQRRAGAGLDVVHLLAFDFYPALLNGRGVKLALGWLNFYLTTLHFFVSFQWLIWLWNCEQSGLGGLGRLSGLSGQKRSAKSGRLRSMWLC